MLDKLHQLGERLLTRVVNHLKHKDLTQSPLVELLVYYFAGRAGGSRRINLVEVVKQQAEAPALSYLDQAYTQHVMPVIWDFAARPYSLGDILSSLIDFAIDCENAGKQCIDVYVLADPNRPSMHMQSHINTENFQQYLFELLPVFNFGPRVRHVHVIQDRQALEKELIKWQYYDIHSVPRLNEYNDELNRQQPFSGYFHKIRAYYEQKKSSALADGRVLPTFQRLKLPAVISDQLLFGFQADTLFVTLHIRQRKNEIQSVSGGALYRDSDMDVWLQFIRRAEQAFPQVMFLVVGRMAEFSRELYRCANVRILKHYGLGLVDELTAIQHSDLFMGGISGPAIFSMFIDTPYVLYQNTASAQEAASYFDEPVGTERPFIARPQQYIRWLDPNADDLLHDLTQFVQQHSTRRSSETAAASIDDQAEVSR